MGRVYVITAPPDGGPRFLLAGVQVGETRYERCLSADQLDAPDRDGLMRWAEYRVRLAAYAARR